MMERRIFLWMGLVVLFLPIALGTAYAEERYRVQKGDSLAKIAKTHGVTIDSLRKANNLSNDKLKPKQLLTIPGKTKVKTARTGKAISKSGVYHVVKKGETLSSIAVKTGHSVSELKKINDLKSHRLKAGQRILLAKTPSLREVPSVRPVIRDDEEDLENDEQPLDDETDVMDMEAMDNGGNTDHSSSLLGKWRSPDERSLVVKVAKGFLGAPYRLGGSSVRGLDCSAFVKKIYELFDVNLPRTAREQAMVGVKIPRDQLKEGDLVFFNTRRAFGHVGIYIGNNEFVHASSGRRSRQVTIDSLDKPYYSKRFVKAVRLMDVEKADDEI